MVAERKCKSLSKIAHNIIFARVGTICTAPLLQNSILNDFLSNLNILESVDREEANKNE